MVDGKFDSSYGLQGKIASMFKGRRRAQQPTPVRQRQSIEAAPVQQHGQVAFQQRAKQLQESRANAIEAASRRNKVTRQRSEPRVSPNNVRQAVVMDEMDAGYIQNIPRDAFIRSGIKESSRPIQLTSQEEEALYQDPDWAPKIERVSQVNENNRPRISNSPRPRSYSSQDLGRKRTPAKAVSVFGDWQEGEGQSQDNDFNPTQGSDSPFGNRNGIERSPIESTDPTDQGQLPDRDRTLYGSDDENEDEARRARDEIDAELDAMDDEAKSAIEDEDLGLDDEPELDREKPTERSCEEFRQLLLEGSIRDIALDISPPASSRKYQQVGISRNWTDKNGNVVGTGTMVDLRRGYVILDTGQRLSYARLSEADWAAISDYWLLPTVCGIGNRGSTYRNWTPQTVTWKASGLCHKPLFFENIQLERYGHSRGPAMQPIHSTVHFFKSLVTVPYQTSITPANECQYALGFYRPGNCAPWLLDPISITEKGLKRQALFITGAAFIP